LTSGWLPDAKSDRRSREIELEPIGPAMRGKRFGR
jgi:hypothetical protein